LAISGGDPGAGIDVGMLQCVIVEGDVMNSDEQKLEYHHRSFFARLPSQPHHLTERVTPTEQAIVLCHLGIPKLSRESWRLHIRGLVRQSLVLTFDDIAEFDRHEVESVHQCAGSPLRPDEPSQRVCNLVWGGVPLSSILSKVTVFPEARYLWSQGADSGRFGDVDCGPYIKDLPLDRIGQNVLLAYEMNGRPLLPEHGAPVRLVVPGFYGTNSVKWLTSLTLGEGRADSPFTRRWYLDSDADGERTIPVWRTAPQSILVSPPPDNRDCECGKLMRIRGWAWGDQGVDHVDVSVDGGQSWLEAQLEPERGHAWRQFTCDWVPPLPGHYSITSRAESPDGTIQPADGRRNALYAVPVTVR
jgi:DMSO/TMAO reductase YedYZ molybdopterin-dependent catalytic subunit